MFKQRNSVWLFSECGKK